MPANRIDPNANIIANVMKYGPFPNVKLPGGDFASVRVSGGQTQCTVPMDQNIGSEQRVFDRFTWGAPIRYPIQSDAVQYPVKSQQFLVGKPPRSSSNRNHKSREGLNRSIALGDARVIGM
jgi:hypothetical protein